MLYPQAAAAAAHHDTKMMEGVPMASRHGRRYQHHDGLSSIPCPSCRRILFWMKKIPLLLYLPMLSMELPVGLSKTPPKTPSLTCKTTPTTGTITADIKKSNTTTTTRRKSLRLSDSPKADTKNAAKKKTPIQQQQQASSSSSSSGRRRRRHTRLSGFASRHKRPLEYHDDNDEDDHHHHDNATQFSQALCLLETANGLVVSDATKPTTTNATASSSSSSSSAAAAEEARPTSVLIRRPCHWDDPVHVEWIQSATTNADGHNRNNNSSSSKDNHDSRRQGVVKSKDDPGVHVEALVGVYPLPSGNVWVWVAKSKVVYDSSSSSSASSTNATITTTAPVPLWQIRKVEQLHLVHLPHQYNHDETVSPRLRLQQRQEELRQRTLWRQALKDHDWYFCDRRASFLPDMTRSCQAFFRRLYNHTTSTSDNETQQSVVNGTLRQPTIHGQSASSISPRFARDAVGPWYDPSSPIFPDSRFFWNEPVLLQPLSPQNNDRHIINNNSDATAARHQLLEWAVPLTSAFVGVQQNVSICRGKSVPSTFTDQKELDKAPPALTAPTYDHVLVSRRSRWRAGTRFTKRGADALGRVANYAETEQVVLRQGVAAAAAKSKKNASPAATAMTIQSHVQIRGSIPLRWSSPTDVKTYRPRVRIGTDPVAQARSLQLHMLEQMDHYVPTFTTDGLSEASHPSLVLVNLVDRKSDQGRLGHALESVLDAVLDVYTQTPDEQAPALNKMGVCHVWFDFHAELKGGRWDKLQTLLNDLQPALEEHGYFQASRTEYSGAWHVDQWQKGVMRTNCMDCLDRTNVVQGIIARKMLVAQLFLALPLAHRTLFQKNPLSLPWIDGEHAHRMLWADNADTISRLYAGTPALKGDFTRTGKRTRKGALDDGMNSLQRYYLNNFLDADRQEGIDLLTCHETFNHLDEGDEEEEFEPKSAGPRVGGLNLKDAARQLLLGATWQDVLDSSGSIDDESNHVRIKVSNEKKSKRDGEKRRELGLLWLPGDLQTQMRELVSTQMLESAPDDLTSEPFLRAMDKRSSSEMPWWIQAPSSSSSSSDDEGDADESLGPGQRLPDATSSGPGFLLAALVIAIQAPMTAAAIVLGVAGAWWSIHRPDEW